MNNEVGFAVEVNNFLVYLDGLPTIRINDLVENEQGVRGFVNALHPDKVEVLLLDDAQVYPGEMFRRLEHQLGINVGEFLIGRAINPLGVPIDGKGLLAQTRTTEFAELDRQAPGIHSRQFIETQFDTGVTIIDTLIPLGRGQRELLVGDARSGKTSFFVDLIVNQKATGVICIFASFGKPITEVRSMIDILQNNQALDHTVIIAASSVDSAPLVLLAPQAAFTIAEYFQKRGKHVLLILDDMGAHAKIYREISLLGNKSPGRESYPGDIFYQQAHLLERAGNFKEEAGGGSITAIPAIELNLNDFTTFIPTNLMSMTDGHLLFKAALYNQGVRPAIDTSLSVSRIGQQTQQRVQNLLSSRIKQVLAESLSLETVSRFSTELPEETQLILHQQQVIQEFLRQEPLTPVSKEVQTVLLALVFTSFIKGKEIDQIAKHKGALIKAFNEDPTLLPIAKSVFQTKDDTQLIDKLEQVMGRLNQIVESPK